MVNNNNPLCVPEARQKGNTMADSKNLTMTFGLDNGDDYDINVANAKSDLTKTTVNAVMQQLIDNNAVLKDGHSLASIKECYVTTTSKQILE